MTLALSNASELYVAPGGPTFHLLHRIFGRARRTRPVVRRIIFLLLITWIPICLFALWQGSALGATPRDSLLLDFSTYARFFIAVPMLVLADIIIAPRLTVAGLQFVRDGLIRDADMPAYAAAITRLARRRESLLAEFVILGCAVFGAWSLTLDNAGGTALSGWRSIFLSQGDARHVSLAALWYYLVATPVFLFMWYRWLWRIVFWAMFLWEVSRLELRLVPTHADRAGGLAFLDVAHASMDMLALAVASVPSAEVAFRIVYEGASIYTYQGPLITVPLAMLAIILGPLLFFCPALARTRRAALRHYGSLVVRYNRGFQEKWVEGVHQTSEPLLGTSDIQSLADLGNSYRFVDDMGYTPFTRWTVLQIVVMAVLPGLPLLTLVLSANEIIHLLFKFVL